jgi:mannose-6-phosphate isomerase-like protein (cupin superfamily)
MINDFQIQTSHNLHFNSLQSASTAKRFSIEASNKDKRALQDLLHQGIRAKHENFDDEPHLNRLVSKPWGQEYRAYADDFLDVWHLRIEPGHATSMHAHPRKATYLLCLSGVGLMTTMKGNVLISEGSVVRIARGAFHSTRCSEYGSHLDLIEVETPRNKFDLVRLNDSYERKATSYETTATDLSTPAKKVAEVPQAVLCNLSPCKNYSFSIHTGMDVFYRRRILGQFLIPIGMDSVVTDNLVILTNDPEEELQPSQDTFYLCITSNSD